MSVLNRTAPAHAITRRTVDGPVTPGTSSAPLPLLGGRYVTTRRPGSAAEGTYVTTGSRAALVSRGTYVTSASQPTGRTEGRYTDRG
ncbi:hypothetical protein IWX64_002747 [Arthrobacter sp. CAN_A212]|uniref:hypothetical protein n=1 Tax=unclassified Arthrobacter TaxID=235627 RepID=UPI0018CA8051|nr:hypothetical protein [Arthrobacter sp. CAN_C5]MBP2215239.1 hypothetical protein [Arthrobacter sp. CAN_C5]